MTDTIVYSHEVGLAKPDARVYRLTQERLAVAPAEILFLDDVPGHCDAARMLGWNAVVHRDTAASIEELEDLIARCSEGPTSA